MYVNRDLRLWPAVREMGDEVRNGCEDDISEALRATTDPLFQYCYMANQDALEFPGMCDGFCCSLNQTCGVEGLWRVWAERNAKAEVSVGTDASTL